MSNNISQFEPIKTDSLAQSKKSMIEYFRNKMRKEYTSNFNKQQELIVSNFLKTNWFCKDCYCKLYRHGARDITIFTLYGEVTVKVIRFRCNQCHILLLPAKTLVPPFAVSSNLQEIICSMIASCSYENVSLFLKRCFSIHMPAKTIHSLVQKESDNMLDIVEYESERIFNTEEKHLTNYKILKESDNMIIGIDGGYYHKHRKKGSYEAKAINILTPSEKTGHRNCPYFSSRIDIISLPFILSKSVSLKQ